MTHYSYRENLYLHNFTDLIFVAKRYKSFLQKNKDCCRMRVFKKEVRMIQSQEGSGHKRLGVFTKFLHPFPSFFAFLLFVFLLVFPKGGIKLAGVPVTWGYGLLFVAAILYIPFKRFSQITRSQVVILLALLPFQIYSLFVIGINGIEDMGYALSFFISFFVLPWIFLGILPRSLNNLERPFIFHRFRQAIILIAVIGIVQFFLKTFTGELFNIPGLTVNLHDADFLDQNQKFNSRGILHKLTSTFQNGLIYGISLCMFFPLFNFLETSRFKKWLVKFSFLLTLSRTVWIALFLAEVFDYFFIKKVTIKSLVKLAWLSGSFCVGIYLLLAILNMDMGFLLDRNLGGRIGQLAVLDDIRLIGDVPFDPLKEMVYFEVLRVFGFIGLVTFIFAITSPLWAYLFFLPKRDKNNEERTIRKCLFLGLLLYLIIACSDGAILYIPVMAFYWGLSSFLLSSFRKVGCP